MSLFGKLLAIFNVLAAIAFFSVAALDYGQRQAWSYTVLRSDYLINGIAFNEKEVNLDGDTRFNELPDKGLPDIFNNAGGNPQKTQLLEVTRVKGAVQTWINETPGDKEREDIRKQLVEDRQGNPVVRAPLRYKSDRLASRIRLLDKRIEVARATNDNPEVIAARTKERDEAVAKKQKLDGIIQSLEKTPLDEQGKRNVDDIFRERRLAAVLLPFASSAAEYEELFQSANSSEPKNDLAALQGQFEALFKQVEGGQVEVNVLTKGVEQSRGTHTLNIDERKLAAAQLLYNLIGVGNNGVTLPRVVAVCGLANTARAIETQGQMMRKLAEDIGYAIGRDRSEFVNQQNEIAKGSRELADKLRDLQVYRREREDQLARQDNQVKTLQANIDDLVNRLKAAQVVTQDKLKEQAEMEKSLFEARKQLRDLQELNQKLELQIRDLEK